MSVVQEADQPAMDNVEHEYCAYEEHSGADNPGQEDPVFLKMLKG